MTVSLTNSLILDLSIYESLFKFTFLKLIFFLPELLCIVSSFWCFLVLRFNICLIH